MWGESRSYRYIGDEGGKYRSLKKGKVIGEIVSFVWVYMQKMEFHYW